MRGYVATVLGGLAGFLAAYVSGGKLLGISVAAAAGRCEYADDYATCHETAMILMGAAMTATVVGVVVTCALGAAVVLRLIRDSAAVETGIAVVPMAALWMGLMFVALSEQDTALTSSWLAVPVVLCSAACLLAAARRLGVAWHRRRMACGSWDAWLRRRAAWENSDPRPHPHSARRPPH